MLGALVALVAGLVVANTTTTQLSESRRDAVATVPLTDEVNLTHGPTAEVTSDHAAPTTGRARVVSGYNAWKICRWPTHPQRCRRCVKQP